MAELEAVLREAAITAAQQSQIAQRIGQPWRVTIVISQVPGGPVKVRTSGAFGSLEKP